MKQLNWYQIFGNTHTIPDGKTVTPTDDIQTLLHCANIWDKSYTTIGEVIADDDTLFLTLIDNNAIDYLVRSTTFASSIVASESAMQYIGASDYASETLLSDSTWNTAILNSAYMDYILGRMIPKMTSNNTPEGLCFAVGVASGYNIWAAFDRNINTSWIDIYNTSSGRTRYIGYQFAKPLKIYSYSFTAAYFSRETYPNSFTVQGSDDGVTWVDIESSTATGSKSGMSVADKEYEYYRLYSTSWRMGGSNNDVAGLKELQFYGREIGGVQSWLKAGGITNKKYTTVSEVLSDLTTLATLMSSSDAIDYLVTAKGWATEICSDSNAMADIGMNNYAANTLLADETWAKAICNSTYYASVLNVSVPTMTDNTHPYGEASASSEPSDPAYKAFAAFDGNDSTFWQSPNTPPVSIQYKFTSGVRICRCVIKSGPSVNYVKDYDIQVSNNGVDWTTVKSYSNSSSGTSDFDHIFATVGSYLYHRLNIRDTHQRSAGSKYGRIATLQFYGRKDI